MMALWQGPKPFCRPWQDGRGSQTAKECNPQFKNGGYVTERKIEAVSLPSARKRAREISEHCVYGSMELLDIEMEA